MSTLQFNVLRFTGLVLLSWCVGISAASAQSSTTRPTTTPTGEGRSVGRVISDSWITMKIHSQFIDEDALEDSDIDVDTKSGMVTLTGTVATPAGRTRANAIAKMTDGVKSVSDQLRVAPEDGGEGALSETGRKVGDATRETGRSTENAAKSAGRKVTDGWIKSKIYAQFLTEDTLEDSDIDIDVTNGVAMLTGTVKSSAGRDRAMAIAKATDGVKNVKADLKVGGA